MSTAAIYLRYPTKRDAKKFRELGVRVHSNGVATIDVKGLRLTVTPGDRIVTDPDAGVRVYSPQAYARAFPRKAGV